MLQIFHLEYFFQTTCRCRSQRGRGRAILEDVIEGGGGREHYCPLDQQPLSGGRGLGRGRCWQLQTLSALAPDDGSVRPRKLSSTARCTRPQHQQQSLRYFFRSWKKSRSRKRLGRCRDRNFDLSSSLLRHNCAATRKSRRPRVCMHALESERKSAFVNPCALVGWLAGDDGLDSDLGRATPARRSS